MQKKEMIIKMKDMTNDSRVDTDKKLKELRKVYKNVQVKESLD